MERFADVQPVRLIDPRAADPLRLAVAAYLARYTGSSRDHAHLDLRCFLSWCAERDLDPLAASRVHLELYIRWMQEVRRFKPSTVSRRFSVTAGFYRTAVIDGVLDTIPLLDRISAALGRRPYRPDRPARRIVLVATAEERELLGALTQFDGPLQSGVREVPERAKLRGCRGLSSFDAGSENRGRWWPGPHGLR
jgi:hypothetical protein